MRNGGNGGVEGWTDVGVGRGVGIEMRWIETRWEEWCDGSVGGCWKVGHVNLD
jgi:hypothetical protein